MKFLKSLVVVALFAIAIYLAFGLKKRIVQQTCNTLGNYKATKSEEVLGDNSSDVWYCCPPKGDKSTKTCLFYGE